MKLQAGRLHVPSAAEVTNRPGVVRLEPAGRWERNAAEFVIDQSGRAEVAVLRATQPHMRHGVYQASLQDVIVFGHHHLHAFITGPDRFDCQEIEQYRRRLDYHVDNHPGRQLPMPQIFRSGGHFEISYATIKDVPIEHVDGRVMFASPTEPLNWGMWLLQALPATVGFVEQRSADRLLLYAARPWQRSLLAAAGLAEDEIVHQELGRTYQCLDLVVPQYTQVDLVPTPSDREAFARVRRSLAPEAGGRKRRIFLSRRSVSRQAAGYRALMNEDDLVGRMLALGFEVHEPELLAFADQIALFRDAELVVGLGGAALFNVVFCEPGTMVVSIESSSIFIHNHAMLFGSLGHRFGFILGTQDESDPTPVHKRWTVDIDGVAQALRRL